MDLPELHNDSSIDHQVSAWFASHTSDRSPASVDRLLSLKSGRSISVVLPARNEAETIGAIITAIDSELVSAGLVDEVIVVDSRSSDRTAQIARAAGATVVDTIDAGPDRDDGKGGAIRTGLASMSGEIGVFLDADVRDFDTDFVRGLLTPLVSQRHLVLVKAFYDRPWQGDGQQPSGPSGGGRVTELVARPLIAQRAPELGGFVQPLSGEFAAIRSALLDLPVVSGYGVDLAMLLQTVHAYGLDAIAQADLGQRLHRHQDLQALGRMALQVSAALSIVLDGEIEVETVRRILGRNRSGEVELNSERVSTRRLAPPSQL